MSDRLRNHLAEYQDIHGRTAIYPGKGKVLGLCYAALGLNGEAGEVAEKIKKTLRDHDGDMSANRALATLAECGDVLWYLTALADELGFTLEDVARVNIEKILGRRERGTLHGEGDNR